MRLERIFFLYETLDEIWEAACEFYSSKENTSTIFEIKYVTNDLWQGSFSIIMPFLVFGRNLMPLKSMVGSV